ncbi:hypothetical protein MNBD_DELTA03-987 [hydrothermal vent metagenome]|uniref:Integrase SAM-like N-terminal domain-containing protein n=1 Tax=hydrothermal vent metagenome TaxID=652676 RepID=A0A3B0WAM0_9ZZZZ
MSIKNKKGSKAIKRFWDQYIQYLAGANVKQAVARWYVIRTEQYIKAFPEKPLIEHTPAEVNSFLEKEGRNTRIKDWQFRQVVDAIRKLFAMLEVSWLDDVDWQHWLRSTCLGEFHPTVAGTITAEETITKLAQIKGSALAEVRRCHGEVLQLLLIQIRHNAGIVAVSTQSQALNALMFFLMIMHCSGPWAIWGDLFAVNGPKDYLWS